MNKSMQVWISTTSSLLNVNVFELDCACSSCASRRETILRLASWRAVARAALGVRIASMDDSVDRENRALLESTLAAHGGVRAREESACALAACAIGASI